MEGYITTSVPSVLEPCFIWFRISGPWPPPPSFRPIVVLHGGPGYTHDYMLPLEDLCAEDNFTLIFFDQLGSGKSTHFREKLFDSTFWTEQFFLDQVTAVLNHFKIQDDYDLLGQSWGGMLAAIHAARQPRGLKRLVINNAPIASRFWREKYCQFRDAMPEHHRVVLKQPRTMDSPPDERYNEALQAFYAKHMISLNPPPASLAKSWQELDADPTPALSALGPDEFDMKGSLANFDAVNEVEHIRAKTLIITGVDEGSDHEESIRLWKQIPDNEYVQFKNSIHFPHLDQRPEFMNLMRKFFRS